MNPYQRFTLWFFLGLLLIAAIAFGCKGKVEIEAKIKSETGTLPPGWYLQQNELSREYRWCRPEGYCSMFSEENREAAMNSARRQYENELKTEREADRWVKIK